LEHINIPNNLVVSRNYRPLQTLVMPLIFVDNPNSTQRRKGAKTQRKKILFLTYIFLTQMTPIFADDARVMPGFQKNFCADATEILRHL
jgi:hypothetical protein